MEVKEPSAKYLARLGYKQTEIGVIPDDWNYYTIQDLIDRGAIVGHLDGNHGELYPRSQEFKESGIPYVTANDLSGRRVSFSNCKYLTEERARRFRKGVAKNGDVLFAHNATVGPTALLSTELEYVILSTTATYFRCNSEKLLNAYLLYALQSPSFVSQYQAVMSQSTRNQVPITAQRKLSLALPPTKVEQHAIAEALGDADILIESLEQLLAKKRRIKQGAMQELLTGKRRLPGFGGEWNIKRLRDICSMKSGEGITTADIDEHSQFPCYGGNGLRGFAKRYTHDGSYALIGRQGALCGNVLTVTGKLFASEHAVVVTPNKETDIHWLSFVLFRMNLNQYSESSAQPGLSVVKLLELECAVPPHTEQTAIAAVLSNMDAELAALEQKLTKARQLKQGMMQELLTGRIRLV